VDTAIPDLASIPPDLAGTPSGLAAAIALYRERLDDPGALLPSFNSCI
jgi:hypothetical protein